VCNGIHIACFSGHLCYTREKSAGMLRLFCRCGYPLWVAARWTGATIELFLLDGTRKAESTGTHLEQCPRCQRRLHLDHLEGYPLTSVPSIQPLPKPPPAPPPPAPPPAAPPRLPGALNQPGQDGPGEPPHIKRRLPQWGPDGTSPKPPGARRILVVDDDPDVRESLRQWLEDEGFQVASAADGMEALAILRREPGGWLILLDLLMPRMDGWALLHHLEDISTVQANSKVVLMSAGWVLAQEGPPWRSPQVVAAVPKPFDLAYLLALLSDLTAA
jgi:CheY-like chemotaxis protein